MPSFSYDVNLGALFSPLYVPSFSYDVNLGALFSPLLLAVALYALNRAKQAVMHHMDMNAHLARELAEQRYLENVTRFDRIEAQTTTTNGKVADINERLVREEARTQVLMEFMKAADGK